MTGKTVLILGGGVGGLAAANELRRLLPDEHRVVLVEKNPKHTFAPSFLWLMTGARRPEQIAQDMHQLVRPGVDLLLAEGQAIDIANNTVQTSTQMLHYDHLVIASGRSWPLKPSLVWRRVHIPITPSKARQSCATRCKASTVEQWLWW
jgi:sulfide:quinone oxidoreductase